MFKKQHEHSWGKWSDLSVVETEYTTRREYQRQEEIKWKEKACYQERRCVDCNQIDRIKIEARSNAQ